MVVGAYGCTPSVDQSAACRAYVACVQAIDAAEGRTTSVERYDADGDCWGGATGGELCDRSCEKGLEWMRERFADLPQECDG